jgi:hypothetical protein
MTCGCGCARKHKERQRHPTRPTTRPTTQSAFNVFLHSNKSYSLIETFNNNMLEYFTFKKVKKHQAEKRAESQVQTPLISEEDENFLTHIVSAEGTPPPLPERPRFGPEAGDSTGNQSQMVIHNGNQEFMEQSEATGRGSEKDKEDEQHAAKKSKRFSFLHRSHTKKASLTVRLPIPRAGSNPTQDKLKPTGPISPSETSREEDDINRVLDDLNLAAVNNRAFSISAESQQLVQKFTIILKDLVNGVPTAYDDLVHLLDDSQGTLAKSYDHLPSFLKKLVTQLPDKLTKNLAPELLAVAAEAQALSGSGGAGKGGLAGAAKGFFKVNTLKDIVTKPGAVVSLLKYILNVLKLRWPAFMGTNVLLSLGLFGK